MAFGLTDPHHSKAAGLENFSGHLLKIVEERALRFGFGIRGAGTAGQQGHGENASNAQQ